ncbi:MAG: hypothetical protein M1814_003394 [Vezdaea aestivalis]|nr:MAG: hypothetical protein M1814_003394 [Vezdaea aestivalis]
MAMNPPTATTSRPTGIPRLSRLPVPRAVPAASGTLRPSPSRERLLADPGLVHAQLRTASIEKVQRLASIRTDDESAPIEAQNRPDVSGDVGVGANDQPDGSNDQLQEKDTRAMASLRKKPRPSLSDRTIETLSQIPPSPSPRRKRSAFVAGQSPIRPTTSLDFSRSRPASRISSRPGSSMASRSPTRMPSPDKSAKGNEPSLRRVTAPRMAQKSQLTTTGIARQGLSAPRRLVPTQGTPTTTTKESQTVPRVSTEPIKRPRASISRTIGNPGSTAQSSSSSTPKISRAPSSSQPGLVVSRKKAANTPPPRRESSVSVLEKTGARKISNSSLTLRETIAKAKAARKSSGLGAVGGDTDGSFGKETCDELADPFNTGQGQDSTQLVLTKRIESARISGRLNISALRLTEIPQTVAKMYDYDSTAAAASSTWYESVDLKRFVAADNEISAIGDTFFPDLALDDLSEDDNGNQFGALEALDMHRNKLDMIPMGLRRLDQLTSVNLSNNNLTNAAFDVLGQISGLRELRLGANAIMGSLSPSILNLSNLETLDLHNNKIDNLPFDMESLSSLKFLNVTENKLQNLPFKSLSQTPIVEILASKNQLNGHLIEGITCTFSNLRVLDIGANKLVKLADGVELQMPALEVLSLSANHITELPVVSEWTSLVTLDAGDNDISSFPGGFSELPNLKTANFGGNGLRVVDADIANMQSLETLRLENNPLRDKKFLTMATVDILDVLRSRLVAERPSLPAEHALENVAAETKNSTFTGPLTIKNGMLDLSHRPTSAASDLLIITESTGPVREAQLHHCNLVEIPLQLIHFSKSLTSLDLSFNKVSGTTYLKESIELEKLQVLNLSGNGLTTLEPLMEFLNAESLAILDISINCLAELPVLRDCYPALQTLRASDNSIQTLTFEMVQGFHAFDVARNEIGSLPPRIGLLGGEQGLRMLSVQGNVFRVPRWDIVEKGTEAVLSWLLNRIPDAEK